MDNDADVISTWLATCTDVTCESLGVGLVVMAWVLGVCSSQGLKFDSHRCQFRWAKSIQSKRNSDFKWGPSKWTVRLVSLD
ncbi:hypothetical protein L195_g046634 [Trifolium pratense]|uniref:Uncharacterized protein n=1 Tax=Trifolium pratense TaxID=57577 RepID=A0A2K3MI89_TRIPR|nr:hypothetical protein L195_g046634 [Trifolium pratense]